jgi:cyclase
MIAKRIIPLFLLDGQRLVKGTRFSAPFKDVGAPLSQGMIQDAQGAEEIIIVDINAARRGRTIDPAVITSMITECRLPIAAGGGIRSLEDARRCFLAGADKVVLNTRGVERPELLRELALEFGAQSVVLSIDVRREGAGWAVYVDGGRRRVDADLFELAALAVDKGAGELVVCSIDREGTTSGFDVELYERLRPLVSVPLIASGGAGSYDDIVEMFQRSDCDGCALGKMLSLRDFDIVRIKSYLKGRGVLVRDA